ncbi:stage II sporulation protein D [Fredinandcohnia salidurans]|uniref:Stage II sporulation protein D n=1 Tax=Fredinandcohnia salidurans TaxID=2595041 RepID=A0ABW4ML47_9BACI
MKNISPLLVLIIVISTLILAIPSIVVSFGSKEKNITDILASDLELPRNSIKDNISDTNPSSIAVSVYRDNSKKIEEFPLEEYVAGVVSSEMSPSFEFEALKAQAIAARTYILRLMLSDTKPGVGKGADVSDTQFHQVFKTKSELQGQWGDRYQTYISKIEDAVKATEGQILTYNGQPIEAQYFSTGNGFTENSEHYWKYPYPYLKSVESPWDKESPKYIQQMKLNVKEFETKLGVTVNNSAPLVKVVSTTPGKRVGVVEISGKEFTGKYIRETLGLASADFTITKEGNRIVIQTKGNGHGVGMSQWGANGMAKEGYSYIEIINHYYPGVNIDSSESFADKLIVQRE